MQLRPGGHIDSETVKRIVEECQVIGLDINDELAHPAGLPTSSCKDWCCCDNDEEKRKRCCERLRSLLPKIKEEAKNQGETSGEFNAALYFCCNENGEGMEIGDIVYVHNGKVPIGLVEVVGDCDCVDNPKDYPSREVPTFTDSSGNIQPWFGCFRKVRVIGLYGGGNSELDRYLEKLSDAFKMGTLGRIRKEELLTECLTISKVDKIKSALEQFKQVILCGPPGTGKTHLAKKVAKTLTEEENIKLIQFHPSYSYEDFVRGIEIKVEGGHHKYVVKDKVFVELCRKAEKDKENSYVLIIDEINRANLPAVLGELIYALEYREEEVELMYKSKSGNTLRVPKNLYIIGTMNTADRSVGHIDYAIRRRFAFIKVGANKLYLSGKSKNLYEEIIEGIFNKKSSECVSSDFQDVIEDIKIGHTYFMGNKEEVAMKFYYQVIPLLEEYIRDGILIKEKVDEVFESYFGKGKTINQITLLDIMSKF